jgi:hypothetical protein
MTTGNLLAPNPYWDALKHRTDPTGSLWDTPTVGGFRTYRNRNGDIDYDKWLAEMPNRCEFVANYCWTIPDPASLAFVVRHVQGRAVDPMAGTGYWVRLLTDLGVDAVAYDIDPTGNQWHKNRPLHYPVKKEDGETAVRRHPDRTLILSWPPYDAPIGTIILNAYKNAGGTRVVYIGEAEDGCCGDASLFEQLELDWTLVDQHVPVQWDGIHDVIRVYTRTT